MEEDGADEPVLRAAVETQRRTRGSDGRSSSETRPSPRVKQAVGTRRVPQGAPARRSGTT